MEDALLNVFDKSRYETCHSVRMMSPIPSEIVVSVHGKISTHDNLKRAYQGLVAALGYEPKLADIGIWYGVDSGYWE